MNHQTSYRNPLIDYEAVEASHFARVGSPQQVPPSVPQYNVTRMGTPGPCFTYQNQTSPPTSQPYQQYPQSNSFPNSELSNGIMRNTDTRMPPLQNVPANGESVQVYLSPRFQDEYPIHFVIFNCILIIILGVFQICTDLLIMEQNNSIFESFGGNLFLI